MADDGKVVIELIGKDSATQTFVKSIQDMQSSIQRLEASGKGLGSLGTAFNTIQSHWLALVSAFGGGYVVTQAVEKFWDSFKGNIEAEHALEKMSERLGATVKDVSGMQFVAERSGVSLDTFNTSITRMTKNISTVALGTEQGSTAMDDLAMGTGKAAQALRELGLAPQVLNNLPLKEKLMAIAEAMKRIPSEGDKVRITLDLMGKGGGGMVPMLKEGAEGIQRLVDRGTQLGVVLDQNMVQRGAAAAIALKDLRDVTHGFSLTLTDLAAPAITQFVTSLNNKIIAMREADPGLQKFTTTVKDFAASWADPALEALKMGIIGGRIAGLQGAAIGAAAGFMGLTTSLQELGQALNNPLVLAFLGGAAGARLGIWGAAAGAAGGALLGVARGISKDTKAYGTQQEREEFGGYEEPMGTFSPELQAQLRQEKADREIARIQALVGQGTREKPPAKGGKGSADTEPARLMTIYDTLFKDIAKLSEGSFSEIDANLQTTLDQIYKKIETRVTTEAELEVMARQRAALQKEKLEDDLWLKVSKASGDHFAELNEQYKQDLKACGNNEALKVAFIQAYSDKTQALIITNEDEKLGRQKEYLSAMAGYAPLLTDQLALQNMILGAEEQQAKNKLDLLFYNKTINMEEWQALEALRTQTAEMARQAQQRKEWAIQGVAGGVRMGAESLSQTAQTWTAIQVSDFIKNAPRDISTSMAQTFVDTLRGKKTDFEAMGWSMAQSFIQKLLEGWLNQVVPLITNSLSGLFGGGGGGFGGTGFSSSFWDEMYSGGGYKQGGVFQRFARGDIFHSPRIFPMAAGYGMMAEAGPEAVMPLTRIGGDLGVKAVGGGPPQVNVIIYPPPNTEAKSETQANGDIVVTFDQIGAAAYKRRGALYKAINSGSGAIRR